MYKIIVPGGNTKCSGNVSVVLLKHEVEKEEKKKEKRPEMRLNRKHWSDRDLHIISEDIEILFYN